jgi:hypothetical protein
MGPTSLSGCASWHPSLRASQVSRSSLHVHGDRLPRPWPRAPADQDSGCPT